jgi:hypothetical protein
MFGIYIVCELAFQYALQGAWRKDHVILFIAFIYSGHLGALTQLLDHLE